LFAASLSTSLGSSLTLFLGSVCPLLKPIQYATAATNIVHMNHSNIFDFLRSTNLGVCHV
jgi:hypothetical protein